MKKTKVCVLRAAGTNCDKETKFAFELCGAAADLVHINEIVSGEKKFSAYQILALPGGFSYGDDVAAGKILANELIFKLKDPISEFIASGKLIIGICNGFQVLVKSGILPGNPEFAQEVTLAANDSGKFEDRWVYLKNQKSLPVRQAGKIKNQKCVWTKDLPEIIYLPVAHGEGKFIFKDKNVLKKIKKNGQIIFQYCDKDGKLAGYPDNPNGSQDNIAGICDASGRILGLMPHPERHILNVHHPRWTREGLKKEGDGIAIFRNGVEYAKKNL